jgi:hypothetical protein
MREIGVADVIVDANRTGESDHSGNQQGLPQSAIDGRLPNHEHDGQSARKQTTAKTRAIVGNQRNETRIDGKLLLGAQADAGEILGYEHGRHSDQHDHRPRTDLADSSQ